MTKSDRVTAEQIRTGRKAVMIAGVETIGQPARFLVGADGARHQLLTARSAARPAPRTVRTTHDGRRVAMRRTGRLALA